MRVAEVPRGRVLVEAGAIATRVHEVAAEIEARSSPSAAPLLVVCVLTGAMVFTADLCRALRIPVEIDTVAVRSYGAGTSAGEAAVIKDVTAPVHDRDVLLVDDIVDTGQTAGLLLDRLRRGSPRSLRLAALLDKPGRRRRQVEVDFRGFTVDEGFVVGYGLDHGERWRSLPDLWVPELDVVDQRARHAAPDTASGLRRTSG